MSTGQNAKQNELETPVFPCKSLKKTTIERHTEKKPAPSTT